MGFARLAETMIRKARGKGENDSLSAFEKISASTVGGALATWNQPIEVIRVEVRCFSSYVRASRRLISVFLEFRCNQWPRVPHQQTGPRS